MTAGRTLFATTVHADPESVVLPPGEVHLWLIATAPPDAPSAPPLTPAIGLWSYEAAERQQQATTAAERARAARLQRPGAAARFLVAHGALRLILAELLACDPRALPIVTGPNGKPELEGTPVHFNLSHSGAMAAVAVARDRPVGVDLELRRPLADLDALARRVCSARELHALRALAPAERPGAFLALWTRKEALAKRSGDGLRALHRDVALAEADGCRLVALEDIPGYAAAVAAEGTDWRLIRRT
jgi:4'-phosphopantetheinyl transferase